MLILTRRNGESLRIGDDVEVRVLAIRGNQVRIGVNAPRDVSVHREEIYKRIIAERVSQETYARDDQATCDLLRMVGHSVPLDTISAWDVATVKAVDTWATFALTGDAPNEPTLRPSALFGYAAYDPKVPE